MRRWLTVLMVLFATAILPAVAHAQCTGPGGVPFNCVSGGTIGAADYFLGGQSGNTVKFTAAQIATFINAGGISGNNTWSGTNLFTGALPVLTNPGLGIGAFATLGGILAGQGSVNDLTFQNSAGITALSLATGTTNLNGSSTGVLAFHKLQVAFNANGQIVSDGSTSFEVHNNSTFSSTMTPAVNASESFAGTLTSGNFALNEVAISSDNVNASAITGLDGFYVGYAFGGSAMTGGRTAMTAFLTQSAKTANPHVNSTYYVALGAHAIGNQNDNGTIGTYGSNLFGSNVIAELDGASFTGTISGTTLTISGVSGGTVSVGQEVLGSGVTAGTYITGGSGTSWTVNNSQSVGPEAMTSGATFWNELVGDEIDVSSHAGSSAGQVIGLQIVR